MSHLHSCLPHWAILNHLPFLDLLSFSQVNRQSLSLLAKPDYLQQRLINLNIEITNFRSDLGILSKPRDAYVKALADAKRVELDPSVLIYMDKSQILFIGIEHYVGLSKMGRRAIEKNSRTHLTYVLTMHPNIKEQREILGTLLMKYMNLNSGGRKLTILPDHILTQLFNLLSQNHEPTNKYYPRCPEDYNLYQKGHSGQDLSDLSLTDAIPYFCGLVDGKQDHVFKTMFERCTWSAIDDIVKYVSMNGTVEMMKAIKAIQNNTKIRVAINHAIKGDNVEIVKHLIPIYLQSNSDLNLVPRSQQMIALLTSFGHKVDPNKCLIGGIISGNYEIVQKYWAKGVPMKDVIKYLDIAPPYLIRRCLTEGRIDINDASVLLTKLRKAEDVGRLEALISLSHLDTSKIQLSQMFARSLSFLPLSRLVSVVGIHLDRYPIIKHIFETLLMTLKKE